MWEQTAKKFRDKNIEKVNPESWDTTNQRDSDLYCIGLWFIENYSTIDTQIHSWMSFLRNAMCDYSINNLS
jgi:hypothetical protein